MKISITKEKKTIFTARWAGLIGHGMSVQEAIGSLIWAEPETMHKVLGLDIIFKGKIRPNTEFETLQTQYKALQKYNGELKKQVAKTGDIERKEKTLNKKICELDVLRLKTKLKITNKEHEPLC